MPRTYEDLMGAIGPARFYRPERRRVRDLLARDAVLRVEVEGGSFEIFDVSMSGMSFLSSDDSGDWSPGREHDLSVWMDDRELMRGRGRVVWRGAGPRSLVRVGLELVAGYLDLYEIARQDDERRLDRALADGAEPGWRAVDPVFRGAVDRAVHFCQFHRGILTSAERRSRDGDEGSGGADALARRALEALREPWIEIRTVASRAGLKCLEDRRSLIAAKAYTETMLTPLLLDVPIIGRAYTKPLGYPGDYRVMQYYYANAFEGDSVFARVMHKLSVEHPLSAGVRTRMSFVVGLVAEEHRRRLVENESPIFRVLSLACGPAGEVAAHVERMDRWPGEIHWTLVDQEDETLSVAYQAGRRALGRNGSRGSMRCLNLAFGQFLKDPDLLPTDEHQDFIFATGLFDYLHTQRAQALLADLYGRLAPGGLLAVGNALAPNEHFWSPEFMLDWTLLYRTRDEMRALAARLPGDAGIEVVEESSGAYYFLLVRRPGASS